jgi:cardiolipin synthase
MSAATRQNGRERFADQTFARTTGAPLVPGNAVRILKDGRENYPAWLEAIASSTSTIHLESYAIHGDHVGREFAEAIAERARQGVRVRVLCDWFGSLHMGTRRLWSLLRRAGVEVRAFNPPRFDSPFGWISRDHRKVITIDGRNAFVSGLCIGRAWVGDPARHVEPWRDTGIAIAGPAVADIDHAFADTWAMAGPAIPEEDLPDKASIPDAGSVLARVVASTPATGALYRLDQLIAAGAQRSLWLTDAYFVGTTLYVQALTSAARAGVDVRLLVPGASDVPLVGSLSRAGYRPLLEAGIRIFEWNGPMLHAKTAVTDSRWARIGSTNLNLTSWIGNWELDVAVQDEALAAAMEKMYLEDLSRATEIVLNARRGGRVRQQPEPRRRRPKARRGRGRRAAAGALGIGSVVSASITNHRVLGAAETRVMAGAGTVLLAFAAVILQWPKTLAFPAGAMICWVALSLLVKAVALRHRAKRARRLARATREPQM